MLVLALTHDGQRGDTARSAIPVNERLAAPTHFLVETLSAIRTQERLGRITNQRASDAFAAAKSIEVTYVDPTVLADRIWELRHNLTAYDAAYVATAEHFGCLLLTSDAKLAAAPGVRCPIVVPC